MTLAELFEWYNVGYFGAFSLAILFLILAIMGVGEHDTDADVDHDLELDHDLDHDLELNHDVDHDIDHDVDHDAEHDMESHVESTGIGNTILSLIGVGKCPLSIIIMSFLLLFTLIGIGSNMILKHILIEPVIYGSISYVLSAVAGFFLTGLLARGIGRLLPTKETYIQGKKGLVGKIGEAVYDFSKPEGFIQVIDDNQSLHEVRAINTSGKEIKRGQKILVYQYDREGDIYKIDELPPELATFEEKERGSM